MKTTLRDELDVKGVQFKRIALLRDDIFTYRLPHNPNALKKTDTRARKHLAAYGELAVELDALRPDILEGKIEDAVKAQMNVRAFNREVDLYKEEMDELITRIWYKSEAGKRPVRAQTGKLEWLPG